MLALVLALELALELGALFVGAPSPGPGGATDEGVIYAPTPSDAASEPRSLDRGIEPVQITPPPERPRLPELQPAPEPVSPTELAEPWDTVMQPPPLPPPPPPPSGAGRLVAGSLTIGLGLAAGSAVVVEAARTDGNPRFVASTFVPLGLACIGVGTYLLVRGARARANFNDWKTYTQAKSRPSGNGLLVAGTMSFVVGGVTLIAAGVQAREPGAFDRPLTPTLFGIGAAGAVFGIVGVTTGMIQRDRYRSWRQSTFLSVVPTLAPTRGGVSFGVAGRF
ncbi:hypothetical protein DB30_03198 [Enhygromyxa salina]|uniref:Uncharacterized protein n=1 Tax=Enhygromyxa salina TaxID=215803 RepID=A0A0C2DCQ2_9BACT|nr:hypothetical protein [Enhygromyxa salina]KIG17497.1 hypothetical protein DB30_03198 [Enhygromyxa salina]